MAFCRHLSFTILPCLLLIGVVAASTDESSTKDVIPTSVIHNIIPHHSPALSKQMDAPSLVEMIMFGLAGIPVYKAVGMLLPFLIGKKSQAKQKNDGRVLNRRGKRDLAYAQQLLNLLITVEVALEKYGITEPQCQLRATCEIYKKNTNARTQDQKNTNARRTQDQKNTNATSKNRFEGNFIKLVNEMRREIQNPKVVPLAKYVFEYYEEAAIRGETQCNCREMYSKCKKSLSQFYKKTKGKKPQRENQREN